MHNKISLSVVILTYNEEKNIEKCLKSLHGWLEGIFIVDSYSTDKTLEISKKYTDKIYQHTFKNYSEKFNWALDNIELRSKWIMRLDADERITPELKYELIRELPKLNYDVNGLYVKRRVYFMGKWIKHGDFYPIWHLRIFRKNKAKIEERWLDEHIKLYGGKVSYLKNDIIDDNKNSISCWVSKHNNYATREAVSILNLKYNFLDYDSIKPKLFGKQEQKKRWLKERIYTKFPLFIRPFLYFIYRYLLRFGFLDGKEGLIFHFLQGFWYRFLVDAKVYEIEKKKKYENKNVKDVIKVLYNIDL